MVKKRDRQYARSVITSGVRETIVAVGKQYYIFWVCVCRLSYPTRNAHVSYYIVICGLPGGATFYILSTVACLVVPHSILSTVACLVVPHSIYCHLWPAWWCHILYIVNCGLPGGATFYILSSVACLVVPHSIYCQLWPAWWCHILYIVICGLLGGATFYIFFHQSHDFRKKKVTEYKTFVLIFSTTFVWKIFHSMKILARYDRRCILVFT